MKRVLVIDDDVQTCQVIANILRERRIEVEIAHTGREGLDKLSAGRFDLVLCDLFLPEVMGYDVAATVKSSRPDLPIVAMSGICRSAQDAVELGIPVYGDHFLAKPLEVEAVQAVVERLLAEPPPATEARKSAFGAPPETPADATREAWVSTLAREIVELFSTRRSGVLQLARDDLLVYVPFVNGFPVDVVAPFRRENVGLFLLQQGRLTREEYDQALHYMVERRRTLEEALAETGLVPATELPAITRAHKRETLTSCFTWTVGRATFREGATQAEAGFQLNPSTLVLDGVGRAFAPASLERQFRDRASCVVRPGPRFEAYFTLFAPLIYRTGLQAHLGSEATVETLARSMEPEPEGPWRLLKAFEILGIIEVVPPRPTAAPRPAAVPPSAPVPESPIDNPRELWRELTTLRDADHYALLGVPRDADDRRIREAFLSRVARYRPERPDLPDDVRRLATEVLLRLAAAYGALADPELRAVYDRRLAAAARAEAAPPLSADAERRSPVDPATFFAIGKEALDRLDFKAALGAFEEARRLAPDVAEYHLHAGLARYHTGTNDPETIQLAVQDIQRATEVDPDYDLAYYHLGQIYREQRLPTKARAMFSRALGANPKNILARRALEELGGVAAA